MAVHATVATIESLAEALSGLGVTRELVVTWEAGSRVRAIGIVDQVEEMPVQASLRNLHESRAGRVDVHDVCITSASPQMLHSATFYSFLRFVGEHRFSVNRKLLDLLEQAWVEDVQWIQSLKQAEEGDLLQNPVLTHALPASRVLTLGPLEASVDWQLASLGAGSVTGVEGYGPNYLKCCVLAAAFPNLPLDFVECDLRDMALVPVYDIVICYGVLYHLNQPQLLLDKIRRLRPCQIFLATQVAVDPPHPAFEGRSLADKAQLLFDGRSYAGRWYPERRASHFDYQSALDEEPSFWFYPEELRQLLGYMGFKIESWHLLDLERQGQLGGPRSQRLIADSTGRRHGHW